jgi:hypothetical protein
MNCRAVDELAAFYVAGVLDGAVEAGVQAHLAACREHNGLISRLQTTSALAPGEPEATPLPASLKAGIIAAVRAEGPRSRARKERSWRLSFGRPSVSAGVFVLVSLAAVALLAWNIELQLKPGGAGSFTLALQSTSGASGQLFYVESKDVGVLTVEGLAPLPADQAYQVWAVTKKGLEARSLLSPAQDAKAVALVSGDISPARLVFVTIEPASGSDRPTGPTVLSTRP